jgi:hypothetical protein
MTRGKIRAGEAVLVGGVRTGEPRHPRDRLPTLFYITQPLLLKRFAQDRLALLTLLRSEPPCSGDCFRLACLGVS